MICQGPGKLALVAFTATGGVRVQTFDNYCDMVCQLLGSGLVANGVWSSDAHIKALERVEMYAHSLRIEMETETEE